MSRRFQFSLSTLFWAMFVAAVFSGGWQFARSWLDVSPVEAVFVGVYVSACIVMAAYTFAIYLNMPLDD